MFKQTLFMVFCNFQMLLLKNVKFGLINFQLSLLQSFFFFEYENLKNCEMMSLPTAVPTHELHSRHLRRLQCPLRRSKQNSNSGCVIGIIFFATNKLMQ
jgi:hypothetical protein